MVQFLSNVTEHEMELLIGVMEGSDCFNLTCLSYTSLSFAEPGGATFLAEDGSSYYVVVAVPWYTQAGPFTLIAGVSRPIDVARVCNCCVHACLLVAVSFRKHPFVPDPRRMIPVKNRYIPLLCRYHLVGRSIS